MLPFFHQGGVQLFDSPRELNEACRRQELIVASTSAIAGLREGWKPLMPLHGVGSFGPVQSVFLEPLYSSSACAMERDFWQVIRLQIAQFGKKTDGLKESFQKHVLAPHGAPRVGISLLTSGASEHSEWLTQTLLSACGHRVQVQRVPQLASLSPAELEQLTAQQASEGRISVMLMIGDPALERLAHSPDKERFDLASLWYEATGLPCVFACWFQCRNDYVLPLGTEGKAAEKLAENLVTWEMKSHVEKALVVQKFLAEARSLPIEWYLDYLSRIEHRLGLEFQKTLHLYAQLLEPVKAFGPLADKSDETFFNQGAHVHMKSLP
jgi:predicted solute-binding protein